jgi:hypothetical protein
LPGQQRLQYLMDESIPLPAAQVGPREVVDMDDH